MTAVSPGPSRFINFKSPIASPLRRFSQSPCSMTRESGFSNSQAPRLDSLRLPQIFLSPFTSKHRSIFRTRSPIVPKGKLDAKVDYSSKSTTGPIEKSTFKLPVPSFIRSSDTVQSPFRTRAKRFLISSPGSSSDNQPSRVKHDLSQEEITLHPNIDTDSMEASTIDKGKSFSQEIDAEEEDKYVDNEDQDKPADKKLSIYESYLQTIAEMKKDESGDIKII